MSPKSAVNRWASLACAGSMAVAAGCGKTSGGGAATVSAAAPSAATSTVGERDAALGARLPLTLVADVPLPGAASRFDYEEIDPARGYVVVAHMNQGTVLVLDVKDGHVVKEVPNVPTARGVAIAEDAGRIFVTSSPDTLVVVDSASLAEVARVKTGRAPDGVAWDPAHRMVGVSDQRDGALSLLADAARGARTQVKLGKETGNVVYDAPRGWFWITVVGAAPPDRLVAVDPTTAKVARSIALPGCRGAHGLRLHPDGASALVACEDNNVLARVELEGAHAVVTAPTGADPDVLSVDPGLGWLYVAAESGDLTVWDLKRPGLALVGHDSPGSASHSVVADPATHRVFFPLQAGPPGDAATRGPVMRIMIPAAIR